MTPGTAAPDRPLSVVIAGGGISGLATAYYLRKLAEEAGQAVDIMLFESGARVGGKIVTERADGFVIEGGPDSFLTTKPWAVDLCRELGLGDRLIPTNPAQKTVYVYSRGKLHPIPDGLRLIAPTRLMPFLRSGLISWPGKLRMGLDLVLPARKDGGDESLGAFIRRRLGAEALARLGEPLMAGIYVSDPDRLSLAATFPQFAALEREHGGVIRGLRAAARSAGNGRGAQRGQERARSSGQDQGAPGVTPKGAAASSMFVNLIGGSAELVEALESALGPAVVHKGCAVVGVGRNGDEAAGDRYRVLLADGSTRGADVLVLATPAPVAARLVAGLAPDLARRLAAIRHLATATVSLAFRQADIPRPLGGTGFVAARDAGVRIVACTWSSVKYAHRAPDDAVLLRAFAGGHGREDDVALDDDKLIALVRADLRRIMGIAAEPMLVRVFRWPGGNPQYDVGHVERVAAIEAACPPDLFVVGAAYRGVGMPDCVRAAQRTARTIVEQQARHNGTPGGVQRRENPPG